MTGLFQHVKLAPARKWVSVWLRGFLESHCAGSRGPCSPAGDRRHRRVCEGPMGDREAVGLGCVTIPPSAGGPVLLPPSFSSPRASWQGPFF